MSEKLQYLPDRKVFIFIISLIRVNISMFNVGWTFYSSELPFYIFCVFSCCSFIFFKKWFISSLFQLKNFTLFPYDFFRSIIFKTIFDTNSKIFMPKFYQLFPLWILSDLFQATVFESLSSLQLKLTKCIIMIKE